MDQERLWALVEKCASCGAVLEKIEALTDLQKKALVDAIADKATGVMFEWIERSVKSIIDSDKRNNGINVVDTESDKNHG